MLLRGNWKVPQCVSGPQQGYFYLYCISSKTFVWTFEKSLDLKKEYKLWNLCNTNGRNWEGDGTHSSTLAWKIPWTKEPGGLQSMESLGVGHDWATSLSLFTFTHWRRKWQPTPVFLPRESQGRGSLVGCCLWGRTESDTTEVT